MWDDGGWRVLAQAPPPRWWGGRNRDEGEVTERGGGMVEIEGQITAGKPVIFLFYFATIMSFHSNSSAVLCLQLVS